jgi:DNA-binding MarR family transcriptional regulator
MAASGRVTGPSSSRPDESALPTVLGGGALLNQVGRQLATTLDRAFARFDLTTQQAALLLHAAGRPTSPSQLTDMLGTDTAGMTRLLDRLEAKGLLRRQRHSRDRRAIIIEVTDTGRDLLPQLPPIFGRVNTQLFDDFTGEEITTCTAMLQRMLTNLAATDQAS